MSDTNGFPRPAIPVTILTGFLGAGKTTLLNRLLNGNHGLRVAVLVNDFGSINVDADLIVGVENDVISLANGCVCCSIRDDLLEAVRRVLDHPEQPEYVLLEASGVADPAGIAVTFIDPGIRDHIRLDSITCVMDAEQVFAAQEQMRLKLWQIGCADMLILNKVDLVERNQIARIKSWLDEHLPRYRLIEAERCDVPLEILMSVGHLDSIGLHDHDWHPCAGLNCSSHLSDHTNAFSAWSYETQSLFSIATLQQVASRLPVNIYRCKGVIYSAEMPERRAILQVVGKRVDISIENEWGSRIPPTQIVVIGARGAIDGDQLRSQFECCLAGTSAALACSDRRGSEDLSATGRCLTGSDSGPKSGRD
jgi:G3E family GTPase